MNWKSTDIQGRKDVSVVEHRVNNNGNPPITREGLNGQCTEKSISNKKSSILEKELQAECERWLRSRGYRRLTSLEGAALTRQSIFGTPIGFFGHWFESQRNAFMPDLMIIAYPNDRPALFVELKVRKKFQPGQREMIDAGMWKLCWSVDEFAGIVGRWEQGLKITVK